MKKTPLIKIEIRLVASVFSPKLTYRGSESKEAERSKDFKSPKNRVARKKGREKNPYTIMAMFILGFLSYALEGNPSPEHVRNTTLTQKK